MQVYSVSYTRLVTLPGDNHEMVHAEALIEVGGETPEEALGAVKAWVLERAGQASDRAQLQQELQELQDQKRALQHDIQHLDQRRVYVRDLLKKHEVPVPELEDDDIPF